MTLTPATWHATVARDMTEKELLQAVRDITRFLRIHAYHTHDSRRSDPGFPDLVVVGTRVLYRELKTEKGRLRPAQVVWVNALTHAGVDVGVWRPADLLDGTILDQLRAVA